jgi:AraC family transcriptional regulator of arabinose operon
MLTGHYDVTEAWGSHWRKHTWRPRGMESWTLDLTISGGGCFRHTRGEFTTSPGSMVLLRPRVPHDYGVAMGHSRWTRIWIHFHAPSNWLPWLEWPEPLPGIMHLVPYDARMRRHIVHGCWKTHRLAEGDLPQREFFAMNALEETLLWCHLQNPKSRAAKQDPRIGAALAFISAHYTEEIALKEIARASGLSVSRLAHLFRAETGTTPQDYLEEKRLSKAQQLLDLTPQSVKEVAHGVGYNSAAYFTRRFKEKFGMSPRAFRES